MVLSEIGRNQNSRFADPLLVTSLRDVIHDDDDDDDDGHYHHHQLACCQTDPCDIIAGQQS